MYAFFVSVNGISSTMPAICGVYGCTVKQVKDGPTFHRFPSLITNKGPEVEELSRRRRRLWYQRLRRADLQDPDKLYDPNVKLTKLTSVKVCGNHFKTGMILFRFMLSLTFSSRCMVCHCMFSLTFSSH